MSSAVGDPARVVATEGGVRGAARLARARAPHDHALRTLTADTRPPCCLPSPEAGSGLDSAKRNSEPANSADTVAKMTRIGHTMVSFRFGSGLEAHTSSKRREGPRELQLALVFSTICPQMSFRVETFPA